MVLRALVIAPILAAACGGGGGKSTTPDPGGVPDHPGVPPLFAALFVDGATFRYTIKTELSHWDDTDPKADQDGNVKQVSTAAMTCTVRGMQNFSAAVAIKLDCPDAPDDLALGRVYVATAAGLWAVDAFPLDDAAVAALPAAEMILAANPAARDDHGGDPAGEGGGGTAITIERRADGRWCQTRSSWGGDESGTTLCFARGKGLVGGGAYFAGGSTRDVTFELAGT